MQDKDKLNEVGLEPDKPKGHVRAIWALTLICAFAIFIAGAIYFIFWYSPLDNILGIPIVKVTDTTSNWNTYTNETYKVQVKYPNDFSYREFPKNTGNSKDWRLGVSFYGEDLKDTVESLTDSSIVSDVTLFIYQNDQKAQFSAGGCSKESDVEIGGKSGELDKCFNEMDSKYYYDYVVVNDKKTYVLEGDEDNKDTLDKMIKTLEFAELSITSGEEARIDTTNWNNTYGHSGYDISLKYPLTWKYQQHFSDNPNNIAYPIFVSFYEGTSEAEKDVRGTAVHPSEIIYDIGLRVYEGKTVNEVISSVYPDVTFEDKKIADRDGKMGHATAELPSCDLYHYLVDNGTNAFELRACKGNKNYLDAIAGTFEFTS